MDALLSFSSLARSALVAGDEVGGVSPGVVGDGVSDMVEEVLDGSLAGDDGLDEEPKHGEHGEAAVLELLHLELRGGVGVIGEPERVERAAGVDLVEPFPERAAADAVALDEAHEHDLARPDGQDALRVHQVRVAQVVQPALREDLRAGLEPHRLAELDAVLGQDLREHAPQRAQHRPPRVDHLQLAVPRERLRVRRQPRRVPPVVAGELAGQVRRRLLRERAKVLGAVRAVPDALGSALDGAAHGDAAAGIGGGGGGAGDQGLPEEAGGLVKRRRGHRRSVYSDASSASRAPDNVLVTGLHLLWLALDICESERQIHAGQYGMNVVQHDDESWVVLSSAEEAFPILTYSTELVSPVSDKVKKESMLTLLVSLMHKYKEENDATFSGSKYCNIPSLIEILLKKFAKLSKECMVTLRQMAPQIVPSTPDHTSTKESLGTSDSMEKKAKARQRQAAIMAKMRAEQSKFAESMKSSENEGHDVTMLEADVSSSTGVVSEESLPVCSLCRESDSKSPLCYLILLQKSRLATFVEMGNPSWENPAQVNKIVSVKREDSTDSSASGSSTSEELVNDTTVEPSFDIDNMEVDAFLDFSNEQHPLIRYISSFPTGHSNSNADENVSLEAIEADIYSSILNDLFGSSNAHIQDSDKMLPSNTSNITVDTKRTRSPKRSVLGTYVSCLSAKHRHSSLYDVASKSSASVTTRNRFGPVDCDGIHISSCGHAVHQECHDRYLFSLKQRYVRRLGFEGGHIVDPDLGELLCPVCRRFANSILPASPDFSGKTSRMVRPFVQTLTPQVVTTTSDVNRNCLQFPRALSLLESAGKIVGESKFLKAISGKLNETTNPALDPCIRRLAMLYYPRSHSSFSPSKRLNPSLFLWDTLRYSLVSTEIASRGRMSSHSAESKSCLESLRGELNSSSGFILSLLFHAAHAARNLNCLEVLLRFEGIQLLAGSICSCISGYKDILNATKRKGSLPSMIDPASEGGLFPDIQFWKQCADPVLAQDPFSSLMSALFCLPVQFLSSAEFFIPFVHLFYVVCAIQALITCYGEETFDRSNFNDCLLNDVCKTMSGFDVAREYFVSKYIDPCCHPKDMVRRLTYPYLRRCALLWELLRSSATSPLYDGSNIWEGSHLYLSNSTQDGSSSLAMELNGLRELEDLFQIQSLDLILQDESVHMLALKWSQHFCEDYNPRKYRGTLFSTPAVPFRLMQLPDVYQVLLERYVKMQCPDCGLVPDEPALCLLCGKLCSPSWKPCCRSGKCQNHALQCGAGIGIFLLVRKTTILLQRSARLAFWPSLYLDAFGEEDHEMQRGKPLYLSQERYTALTYLVASHSLDRTSEVLRQTTISFYD